MYDLDRFIRIQDDVYSVVLDELREGRKRKHWMWYIFPQISGLGHSSKSQKYAISSLDEAKDYIQHPILGSRLIECSFLMNKISGKGIKQIFSYPDDLKFISCMTLFEKVSDNPIFGNNIVKYADGVRDKLTLGILDGKPLRVETSKKIQDDLSKKNWIDYFYEKCKDI